MQKQVRAISFSPVMVRMAATIMGGSKSAVEIIGRDPLDDHGHIPGMVKVIHETLLPGAKLDSLNRRSVQLVTASMDSLASGLEGKEYATLNMYHWIGQQVLMATTESIYGPQNPFRDDGAVQAFQ